jgi:hypothetical protein
MTATPELSNLEHALHYARRGWRVVPVPAGRKVPTVTAWQREGTTDEARIRHWWTEAPDHGIGIVCGAASGLWVLDVDVADGKAGDETLAELVERYGPLPETFEVITGSGGRHIYFRWDGTPIRNSASGALGPGLDVRGEGGFVVAPPSLHASGRRYEVEASSPEDLAAAPAWLLELLTAQPETRERTSPTTQRTDRPGDQWSAATSWDTLLAADGWTKLRPGPEGEDRWVRPGKDPREGPSATVGYGGSDVLKVFTSSHPTLRAEETYSKLGYIAFTRHGGDFTAARRWCEAQGFAGERWDVRDLVGGATGTQEAASEAEAAEPGDWAPVDLSDVLSGNYAPPAPTIATPAGQPPLLYPSRCNAIFGESGTGKTWVAIAAMVEVILAGGKVVLIDLEDSAHGITSRLLALGIPADTITEGLIYLSPQTSWGPVARVAMAQIIEEHQPELVVLDSTGEAMAASGVKGNDDDDVARWFVTFPKWIARRGPAVLIVDHVPKDPNAPSRYMIGSQRKTAAIDGASYRLEAVKVPSRSDDGLLKVIVAKDRHGTRAMGTTAAMVHVTHSLTEGLSVTITAPDETPHNPDGTFRPTILMEQISKLLEAHPGLSTRQIQSRLTGRNETIAAARTVLEDEGWIERDPTQKAFAYIVAKPYRQAEDPVTHGGADATESVIDPVDNPDRAPRPTAPQPRPGRDVTDRAPRPLSLREGARRSEGEGAPENDDRAPDPPPVDNFDPDLGPIDDELRAIEALMEDL